jgi:hypothetical protein
MQRFLFKRKILNLTLSIMLLTFSLAGATFSQATVTTSNQFVPIETVAFVPCANGAAGENVLIQGILHIQEHMTINDNRVFLKVHFQPQGVVGIGTITGDSYQGTGVTQFQDSIAAFNGAVSLNFINNFRLIGQGSDNNLQVHQNTHLTIDANGFVTANVNNTSVECN